MITHTDKITMLKNWKSVGIATLAMIAVACGSKDDVAVDPIDESLIVSTPQAMLSNQNMDATLWFHTSAEADYLFRQCYDLATIKLNRVLNSRSIDGIPVVILDLDETVLDNSPYQLSLLAANETFSDGSWAEWVQQASAEPLPGALEFTIMCRDRQVEVYYVSNRSLDYLEPTITNLKKHGFPFADIEHVFLMEGESDKSSRRERVASMGDIVLYCGDNLRDYREDFSERSTDFGKDLVTEMESTLLTEFVIFPNPMYGEWTKAFVDRKPETEIEKKDQLIERLNSQLQSQREAQNRR